MSDLAEPSALEQMLGWAYQWRSNPDSPVGPLELERGSYTAAMARGPFVWAVVQHCTKSFGQLCERRRLEQFPAPRSPAVALRAYLQRQVQIVQEWAAEYALDREWFTRAIGIHVEFLGFGGGVGRPGQPRPDPTGLIEALDGGEIFENAVFETSEPDEAPEFFAFYSLKDVLKPVGANPFAESLEEFLGKARQHYHARTSMFLALGARPASAPNGGHRRARRVKGKPSLDDHCMWLALYQVEGLDVAEVARRVHRERTTVSNAVHALAQLLDITLRESRPGRRPRRN